ncbi:MAG: hypothetical protein ACP5N9_06805 [Candidatus Bilamarchaeum sp.]|jgi:hypothetical protein
MNKLLFLTGFVVLIFLLGCIGGPSSPSSTAPSTTTPSGSGSLTACNADCRLPGLSERTVAVCEAGCTLEEARRTRDQNVCLTTLNDRRFEEMARTYYYGCLDVVAGAMNSTTPCQNIPDSEMARRNACISAAATDSRNPSLCDQMRQDNFDNDTNVQSAYDRSYQQMIRDCKDSAQ